MKLTVLTENAAGGRCLAEHGLSYLIESQGNKVLLDAGHSDVFLRNAAYLGIDLNNEIDSVILSHGHWDHGDGLRHLKGKSLYFHPQVFINRYRRSDDTYLGLKMSEAEMHSQFNLHTSISPIEVKPGILFLGEIPRINDFEAKSTPFIDADGKPDFVLDDSAVVVTEDDGIVVITGCAHAGICNTVAYAISVTGVTNVKAVVGGFHLKKNDAITSKTIEWLKEIGVQDVLPTHCTELEALSAFSREFGATQLKTGMTVQL